MQNIDKEEDKKVLKNQNEQKVLGSGGIRTHASSMYVYYVIIC
jgi:ribosomal protein L15